MPSARRHEPAKLSCIWHVWLPAYRRMIRGEFCLLMKLVLFIVNQCDRAEDYPASARPQMHSEIEPMSHNRAGRRGHTRKRRVTIVAPSTYHVDRDYNEVALDCQRPAA